MSVFIVQVRMIPAALLCVAGVALSATTHAAPLEGKSSEWTQQVLSAEQRQNHVTNRMESVTSRFRDLINDLRSNGIIEEHESQEMLSAINVLDKVKDENVRQAIVSLRAARTNAAGAGIHLEKADGHVDIAVKDLTDLLKLAHAVESSQLLRQELQRLLRQEELLWAKCREQGRAQLEGNPVAPAELVKMATAQSELAKVAAKLRTMFHEAVEEAVLAEERELIATAGQLFVEGQVEGLLTVAALNIEEGSLVGAVLPQQEAIEVLKKVVQLLKGSDGLGDLTQMLATLQDILTKQRELRTESEAAAPPRFLSLQRQLQGRQRDLLGRLDKIDPMLFLPQPSTADTNPIEDATQSMAGAELALGSAQQAETVTHQLAAEEALERAIAMLEEKIAKANESKAALGDPLANMAKLVQSLKELYEQQVALRQATEKQAESGQDVSVQTAPQQGIVDRTIPLVDLPEAEPVAIQEPLRMALFGMEDAVGPLSRNNAVDAIPAQIRAEEGLAEALRAAEKELGELKEQAKIDAEIDAKNAKLDAAQKAAEALLAEQKEITKATEAASPEAAKAKAAEQSALAAKTEKAAEEAPPEVSEDFQKAAEAMKAAAEALKMGDKEAAAAEQAKAADALKKAASKAAEAKAKNAKSKGGKGKSKGPGKSKGAKGKGKASKGPGEGEATAPPPPGPSSPSKKNIDAVGKEREFAKGEATGERPDDIRSDWRTLGSRKQEANTENYIQQLPVEYRELLKNYYQALSAEN